jgi:hypothetical protein
MKRLRVRSCIEARQHERRYTFAVPFRLTSKAMGPVMNGELKDLHAKLREGK